LAALRADLHFHCAAPLCAVLASQQSAITEG
jgi:hypothetical protein